ncbi:CPBP family intramembrane metalloprotease [Corynebacterium sp. CCM 8835]|uniref:CPBP family intramembrane metalloprotease n=1 Tax=Corynebacterium antarcticum TaxID=2800405 RepID=A0A9Q4CAR9_9CORY|nr:CPBP family intramembrane glutamic endopeptidase [Corynebacterium antarcticum]MCK7660033.1 CPBP family intramembrane metalloprotease [Corynebacterium antarcticum]MCL0245089.1 CPBP family intramembrane metalloprotease [Corynebacterium antarcticum]MCX7537483.1 CPBP family intramembrane metalloprotease [Corynebacterium antarcticum]MCX7539358.1 CPBP family intramembrane metalloprotease [Corynebacterium antarcticum]
MATYGIPLLVTGLLYVILGRVSVLRDATFRVANIRRGGYLLFAGVILSSVFFIFPTSEGIMTPSVGPVVFFVLGCLMTGIWEELLCRGLIQNTLVDAFGTDRRRTWWSIVASSAIFAVMHFVRLITDPHLVVTTTTQVLYAFAIGLLLGVIYYFTRDLVTVILLHAGFNMLGGVSALFTNPPSGPTPDMPLLTAAILLVMLMPSIWVARRMYVRETAKE